ncbi:hypothetical protein [Aureimonas sp. AU20]|uniref:hypothetical protein n=1 Tax=Aureimonas sp. AU20 TaxID=1349819 RepID=UPI000722E4DD|nr:hypothetical protein [Aureimonas sp. AU20]ALN75838.1 hypothetical protein M673_24085 [Aureimonas sp. AU20]
MSTIIKRLAAVEKQIGRKVAFVPRHIPLLAYDDPEAVKLRAEDKDPSDGIIRAIFIVGVEPDLSRFNDVERA